ncbi:HET-domain-containing protein [Daldinia vernicosa]|uniref:HET-domain-containing protein n=1 Tax=Daldinia vernicosa TaxID=114800 RepID=UPI002008B1B0|nr:HET-domain-containing protein [Daldinia vernicosa]KAI0847401.1 HET-domain-containing protein [Daldinia vernicosa]
MTFWRLSSPDPSVCPRCQKVPWQKLTNPKYNEKGPIMMLPESHEQLKSSNCRICRLLADTKTPSLDGKDCELRLTPALYHLCKPKWSTDIRDSSNLIIVSYNPESPIQVSRPGQVFKYGFQRIDPDTVSFQKLQECVLYCHQNHADICTRPTLAPASRFRVIDCNHSKQIVVSAPMACKYAALSYVWGSNPHGILLGNKYSQVVIDAIKVTISMKLRYLWVDRHCINQNDEADKSYQISQMGNIYANAEITIIAAAGTDPTYGLPGISRPRKQQSSEVINGVIILGGLPHPGDQLKESAWASRGWTYQEGFLSPRRLIFTDYEVSYLCDATCLAEHYKIPIDMILESSIYSCQPFMLPQFKDPWSIDEDNISIVHQVIMEYSRRQLGYPADALRAMSGVIQLLELKGIVFIWGVAIYERVPMIYWYHNHPTKRRPNFPSWSFLGWDGPIEVRRYMTRREEVPFKVSLGDRENLIFDINLIAATKLKGLGENAPRYLHLTGFVVDLPLENIQQTEPVQNLGRKIIYHHTAVSVRDTAPCSGVYASLKICPGLRILAKADIDESNFTTCPVVGFLLASSPEPVYLFHESISRADFLLLRHNGTYYERIGYLSWRLKLPLGSTQIYLTYDYRYPVYFIVSDDVSDEITIPDKRPLWLEEAEKKTVVVG